MPYAKNGDVNIYYEVEGEGEPLVLAHAAGSNIKDFRNNGYVDALKNDYTLVLFDARGFGMSDKPHTPADYDIKIRRGDVLAVLDDAGITQSHFLGYSMGTVVGIELMTKETDRFYSFILGGTSPYGRTEAQYKGALQQIEIFKTLKADPEAYFQQIEKNTGRSPTPEERNQTLSWDVDAFIAVIESQLDWAPLSNDDLSRISVPILLYCGSLDGYHDGAKKASRIIPHCEFVSLPNLNHGQAYYQSDLILPHIKEFLTKVTKGA